MERVVGTFVILAALLMLAGFGYYIYSQAEQRGWFEIRAPFYTYSDTGSGVAPGDPVKLMGFEVGRVTAVRAMPARGKGSDHNVQIDFEVVGTNYSYIWTNSTVELASAGFLGKRELDITKGTKGYTVYLAYPLHEWTLDTISNSSDLPKLRLGQEIYEGTNLVLRAWQPLSTNLDKIARLGLARVWTIDATRVGRSITGVWNNIEHRYEAFEGTNVYLLTPDEPPALMDRVNELVSQVQDALPGMLKQVAVTLSNSAALTSNLNAVAAGVRPIEDNLAVITGNIKNPEGSLGEWLIPTNVNRQLALALLNANGTLTNVNSTVTNVNTNLAGVFQGIDASLENLAGITSNLNRQVEANSNMLTQISDIVVHSDQFIQGLKHFWLFRHSMKKYGTNDMTGKK
jgi:ABC-type transporter Mla subunit MlaD